MRKSIFILLAIFLTYSACDTDDTPIMEDYSELYGSLKKNFESWEKYSDEDKIAKLSEFYYLGEPLAELGLLGLILDNSVYFERVNDIVALYKRYFVKDGMLRPRSLQGGATWYRDQFARDNKNLYESFVYTRNPDILQLVEQQVAFWLYYVPRAEHNGYVIFPYGISEEGSVMSYEIDPNQNLQVASIFSQLYWDSTSTYYKDQLFKEIVYNEVNAVLDIQKENGALPLREYLPFVEDSNYGGYSGCLLYHLAQMWGETKWIESTIKIGEWLHRDFSEEHPWNTPDDGRNFSSERYYPFNLIGRILPFYAAGISKKEISDWIDYIYITFPNKELNLETQWYFYQSIPRSYLTERPIPQRLTPFIYNDRMDKDCINVRVVGELIKSFELIVKDRNGVNIYDEKSDEVLPLRRKISLRDGSYFYKVIVSGNDNKINTVEESFEVDHKGDVLFNITIFDSKNTFQKILNN